MSDKSTVEMEERKKPSDATTETLVAAERQRIIDRVLTYAALRDQAAVMLDKAASSPGPEKPSEGAAERARAQAEVARDIARYLADGGGSSDGSRPVAAGQPGSACGKGCRAGHDRRRMAASRGRGCSRPGRAASLTWVRCPMSLPRDCKDRGAKRPRWCARETARLSAVSALVPRKTRA